jgi:hypothetical protein
VPAHPGTPVPVLWEHIQSLIDRAGALEGEGLGAPIMEGKIGDFTTDFASDPNQLDSEDHGLVDDVQVWVGSDDTLPDPLVQYELYFVVNSADGVFELSLTLGGPPITLTTDGVGNHRWYAVPVCES